MDTLWDIRLPNTSPNAGAGRGNIVGPPKNDKANPISRPRRRRKPLPGRHIDKLRPQANLGSFSIKKGNYARDLYVLLGRVVLNCRTGRETRPLQID